MEKLSQDPNTDFSVNRSTILINAINDDKFKFKQCDYCKAKRLDPSTNQYEEDLSHFMNGFTSGKFRIDDFERLLNLGYTRSGNFFYHRDLVNSCCEVYQYRVDTTKFAMSAQ